MDAGAGGATAAADDIGGVHHQRVKLSVGADGSASDGIPVSNGLDTTAAGVLAVGPVGQFDDAATGAVTENQFAPLRITSTRRLMTSAAVDTALPAGTNAIGKLAANSGVDIGDVDVTSIVPGAAATNLGKAEDAAHSSGDVGVMALSVRQDAAAALAGTDADYQPLITDANGRLHVIEPSAAASAASLSVLDDWDNAASDGASVSGDVAHDSADAGEPVKVGGRADTTFQTAVADGDRVNALFDVYGLLEVRTDHPNKWFHNTNGSSALTDTEIAAAPGAGLSNYLTDIIFSSGAGTAINMFVEEGASKKLGNYYLEAIAGRSMHLRFATPYKATANTALTVTTSAAIAHTVTFSGFIAP